MSCTARIQEVTGDNYINYIECTHLLHTHNSLSAEASNLEVIYSDDNHYEFIAEQPTSKVKEGDTDSMCGNSAYELADQGEGVDFKLTRNDSYEVAGAHVDNLCEETTH